MTYATPEMFPILNHLGKEIIAKAKEDGQDLSEHNPVKVGAIAWLKLEMQGVHPELDREVEVFSIRGLLEDIVAEEE